jgi:hypothetical protein
MTRKTLNRFKEHSLKLSDRRAPVCGIAWINAGRPSDLWECDGHCDWLGWLPSEETEERKAK